MRSFSFKNTSFILIVVLLLAFVFAFSFTMMEGTAFATDDPVKVSTITIGHTSDIHYFPYERGYTPADYGTNKQKYLDSDFYYSMTGDTKLVEESAAVFDKSMENIYQDAKLGKAPLVLVASGDLSKNGERDALLDVANRLRLLQNDIRALGTVNGIDYSKFQVLAVPGNHDLFNDTGAYYTKTDGSSVKSDGLNLGEFALIFSGLGFPNNTLAQLSTILPEEYWFNDWDVDVSALQFNASGKGSGSTAYHGQFVYSTLSDLYDFEYFNENLQNVHTNNSTISDSDRYAKYVALNATYENLQLCQLSYVAHAKDGNSGIYCLDATFRSDGHCKVAKLGELNSSEKYYRYNDPRDPLPNGEKYGYVALTQSQAQDWKDAGNIVYVDTGLNHETGGEVTEACLYWVKTNFDARKALVQPSDGLSEPTYSVMAHQNFLEHWEQEGEILKDFTLYGYEYTTKFLLNAGIRYGYTGHMHADDVMYYTDAEGRTFYDIETGSLQSYSSPQHYYTIDRYQVGTKLAEKFTITNRNIGTFNYDINGDGNLSADEKDINFNAYSWDTIYGQLIDRVLTHFVADRMVDSLLDTVRALFADDGPIANVVVIGSYHEVLGKIVDTLIDQLLHDMNYGSQPDLVKYLYSIVDDIVSWEFGEEGNKMNVKDLAGFISSSHAAGIEIPSAALYGTGSDYSFSTSSPDYVKDTPTDPAYRQKFIAACRDLHNQCLSGKFVEKFLNALLNPLLLNDDSLIKQLLSYPFDLTKADFTDEQLEDVETLIAVVKEFVENLAGEEIELNININRFVIGEIVNPLLDVILPIVNGLLGFNLVGDDLVTMAEEFLDSYLVDSFYVGIGGIVDKILVAFATDDYKDAENPGDLSLTYVMRSQSGLFNGQFTYLEGAASEFIPTQDKGSLPSIVNGHFEGTTGYTLTYYTDETIYTAIELYDSSKTKIDEVVEAEDFFKHATAKHPDASANVILNSDKLWQLTASSTKISVKSVATPTYQPLIDLGLAAITHTEVFKEVGDDDEVPIDAYDRDLEYETNGVSYWNRHTVTLSNLTPNTTYYVKLAGTYVTSTGETKKFYLKDSYNNDSEFFSIKTGADATVENYNFIALADIQGMTEGMYENTADLFESIRLYCSDHDFILNAGDVGDNGKNFAQMQWAYDKTSYLFTNTSTFMTSGNHENGTYMMKRFTDYTLPAGYTQTGKTGYYYSFDYATSHIIVLDTNDANEKGLGADQLTWLKADLAANNSKFTFVLMHKSLYSSGSHTNDAEIVAMRSQLVPLFAQYNVDIVFAGHDHTYATTYRLGADGKETNDLTGVLYMTLGTAGTKFYTYKENDATTPHQDANNSIQATLDTQTFAYISVNGDMINVAGYKFVKKDGSLVLISENGALNGTILDNINKQIKDNYGTTGSVIKLKFGAKSSPKSEYITAPEGYSVVYKVGDQRYSTFKDIVVKGNEKVNVDVYLVNSTGGEARLDTVTLEIGNYTMLLAICIAIPICVVLIGCAVGAVLLIKKKKKA